MRVVSNYLNWKMIAYLSKPNFFHNSNWFHNWFRWFITVLYTTI